MNNLRQDIKNIFNGQTPIKRQNPKAGESQYYFINPNQNVSSFNDLQTTDITDEQPLLNTGHGLEQNNYLVPQEVYTEPNWGQQTAAKLDEYMQNYNSYPGITHTGIAAPFHDMWRNYKTMTDEQKWTGGDNFFHCKANYEAAKRGPWGEIVGKTVSAGREILGQLTGDQLSDLRKDWHANRMGWRGAKKGLSLQQSCPTNPKAYVNPDDYDDIF